MYPPTKINYLYMVFGKDFVKRIIILFSKAVTGNGNHLEKINVANKAAGTMLLRLIKNNGTVIKKISIVR